MLRVPQNGGDDTDLILAHSRRVMEAIRCGDALKGEARDGYVIDRLKEIEASYS